MNLTSQSAVFSADNMYRYELFRQWNPSLDTVMFIGLNPSVATDIKSDKTISTCINRAHAWGYGGIYMCNLFAFVSMYPQNLLSAKDPVGPENDAYLKVNSERSKIIVAMWGNAGSINKRSEVVKEQFLGKLYYLKLNQSGEPSHTRGLKLDLTPSLFLQDNTR